MPTNKLVWNLDELEDYDWMEFPDVGGDDELVTEETLEDAAKAFKVSPALVKSIREALRFMASEIIEKTKSDMEDLYKLIND